MKLGICILDQQTILLNSQKLQQDFTMLKKLNSYTLDIFINGPLIFLSTAVDISSNGDEPLLNLTTLIFLWMRLDLFTETCSQASN